MLDAAESLEDLRVPAGNRLEKLPDRRAGLKKEVTVLARAS